MKTGLQQGQADGLCGLYAILGFLAATEQWKAEEPAGAMRYLFEAAHGFGWLTPHNLTGGFEGYQLKAILDMQIANYRMPYQTFFLEDVVRTKRPSDFFELAEQILEAGGSIVGGPDGRCHWLLLTRQGKGRVVINSADPSKPVKKFDRRSSEFSLDSGVIIMPKKLPPVEIEL